MGRKRDLENLIVDQQLKLKAATDRIAELEGKMDSGMLIGRPEVVIARAARIAHEANRAYCEHLGDNSQAPWADAEQWDSAIAGVKAILENRANTPPVLHALWCRQKKEDGWVYGEKKDAEAKTHPCLVPYSELPPEQKFKDVLFQAVVRAALGVEDG